MFNSMVSHMVNNPGHRFDLNNPIIMYKSCIKRKRQLVESSLIATNVNCNLKPGDFPVCKLTAAAVLKSCKIDSSLAASSLTSQSSSQPSDIIQSTSSTIPTPTLAVDIPTP